MSQINEAIVSRIKKLLALSRDGGATEAEAALAAEKAQQIMADHNLSMATVERSGGASDQGSRRAGDHVVNRTVYRWQRDLMQSIAKLNFCACALVFSRREAGKAKIFEGYELIGREANIVSTRATFEYLVKTIDRLAREEMNHDGAQLFTKYACSFREGCSDRIVERLGERQEQLMREQEKKAREADVAARHPSSASRNLPAVVLRDYAKDEVDLNNDFVKGWEPGTTAHRRAEQEHQYKERVVAVVARKAQIMAQEPGINPELAEMIATGYSRETAERFMNIRNEPAKPETVAQRRKREEREERYWERLHQQEQRRAQRLDGAGYNKGRRMADDISLSAQVKDDQRKKIGG